MYISCTSKINGRNITVRRCQRIRDHTCYNRSVDDTVRERCGTFGVVVYRCEIGDIRVVIDDCTICRCEQDIVIDIFALRFRLVDIVRAVG
jgi:hypothetical protein